VGETPATIILHELTINAAASSDALQSIQQKTNGDCVRLTGGESKVILLTFTFDFGTEYEFPFNFYSGGVLRIRGLIEYVDDAGIKRRTGFLRTYDQKLGRFDTGDDREEEYED
jgi:hypothetical protein